MEEPQGDSPKAHFDARESISLAFVAALQRLPPRQRALFLLRDVLGFRSAEAADILGCTADAANASLKRARATIASHLRPDVLGPPPPGSARERELLARFTAAAERGDVEGRRLRLIPTRANGQPAFACYVLDPQARIAQANGLIVLTLDGDRIRAVTHFPDNSLLSWFGLPRALPRQD